MILIRQYKLRYFKSNSGYEEILARDKTSLDITWVKDKSLADLDNLPDPDVLAEEIAENLSAALENFRTIVGRLQSS